MNSRRAKLLSQICCVYKESLKTQCYQTQQLSLQHSKVLRVEEQPLQTKRDSSGFSISEYHVGLVIVLNPDMNHRAINEAYKLNIPIVALVDSNMDREYLAMITYPIFVNNVALRFVYMFLRMMALVAKK
eukprot:TRINITY_DN6000_c1_g1_i13.p5 TRINITY_DN6000_c1_g1~~TRINITY_DN6000_c1_g1_i13.p5  ORF type:complete len:130 (-),score=3.93 TRINITY_DN6000_c1_g1_i13:887-1276(-)